MNKKEGMDDGEKKNGALDLYPMVAVPEFTLNVADLLTVT